jgi:multimeric flavodoxin WrbA
MKLLIISGTPKTDGITHSLVTSAQKGAQAADAQAETVVLSELPLTLCRMCGDGWGVCFNTHRCAFGDEDGFNRLQEKFNQADGYIFITPVYWGEVSEGMKTFLDRLRRCEASKKWNEDAKPSFFAGKSSILVASAGGGGGGITSTFAQLERAITQMGGAGYPYDVHGFYDYIAVNRWNQEYKREALKASVASFIKKTDAFA